MTINFKPGEIWSTQDRKIAFERHLGGGHLHFTCQRTFTPFHVENADGLTVMPDMGWAIRAYALGDLVRILNFKEQTVRDLAQKREYDAADIHRRDRYAARRRFVVDALDKAGVGALGDRRMAIELSKIWADAPEKVLALGEKPTPRTVRRWLMERGQQGDRPLRQMLSMSGRVERRSPLDPTVLAVMQHFVLLYWSDRAKDIASAFARLHRLISYLNRRRGKSGQPVLKIPSEEAFRKRVRKLECFETYRARYGEKAATLRFKPCGEGLKAERFLELGCLDHKLLDNVVVMNLDQMLPMGRPWLTAVIDVKTRCIVGFVLSFEPPSLYSVTECIKRANAPKLHLLSRKGGRYAILVNIFGRFDEIVVDNGLELAGNAFEDAMADVGTSVRWAPIRSPTHKAVIERFFRTIDDRILHKLPGSTLDPKTLRDLEIDPHKDAILTLEDLEDLIWEAISFYHMDVHDGVGAAPANLWDRDLKAFAINVIGDVRQLDKMAGAMEPNRRLTKAGIEFLGLQYHDQTRTGGLLNDLAGLAPRTGQPKGSASVKVKIKYNPANLGEIHVWNDRRNRYVTLPCTDIDYASGLSKTQHEFLRKLAGQENEAFFSREDRYRWRAELCQRVERLVPGLKLKNRRTIARLLQSPMVQGLQGEGVALAFAPARHDGLAPVIENDTLAEHRADGGLTSSRPPRGGAKRKAPKPAKPPKGIKVSDEGVAKFGGFNIKKFKGFGNA